MLKEVIIGNDAGKGRVRAHQVRNDIWLPQTKYKHNLVVYEWGAIVTRLLGLGQINYRIAGMYLEFENVASPGDPVAVPTFDRTRDIEYYNNLVGSGVRDYLRVPLTAHTIASSDEALYPKGNLITFFARSQGLQGVHGKTFSDSVNSTVFGGSLIAFVDDTDATQDLILSSFYFDTDDQQPKLSTSQVGLEWELTLQ
jgi:hypothetical protein